VSGERRRSRTHHDVLGQKPEVAMFSFQDSNWIVVSRLDALPVQVMLDGASPRMNVATS
jgi:hypothetical protein